MKYFNPTYWFKLWVLSAPLFNSENQGIYAKSIDNNQKIKDWISKDISLESINEQSNLTNWNTNYQSYSLNETNQNINPFYQSYLNSFSNQQLETNIHTHRHEKSKNRIKRYNRRLKIEPISQLGKMWCGLAVAEMVLRYFNINVNTFISDNSSFPERNDIIFFQRLLGFLMRTDNQRGTEPQNFFNNFK